MSTSDSSSEDETLRLCAEPQLEVPRCLCRHKKLRSAISKPQSSAKLQTFHLFPLLPPELQLIIWQYAIVNCYRPCVRSKPIYGARIFIGAAQLVKFETLVCDGINGRRWMGVMLACKMAKDVAKREKRRVGARTILWNRH